MKKASNQHELAEALGISRQTVHNWSRKGAPRLGADRLYDVAAWKKWAKENDLNKETPPDLKDELLKEQIRRLRLANDAVEERQVPLAEVFAAIRPTLAAFRQSLDALPHRASMKIGGNYHDVLAILEHEVGITLRGFVGAPWFDEEATDVPIAEVADIPDVAVPNEVPVKKPRGRPPKKK
jgi:transcriptional regulator with XRE-family HTH domain